MDGELIRLKSFPRYRVIGRELFACRVSEVDLWQSLGAPTSEVNPPLGQGTPEMFWDVEFPCGLVMGLQFDCISERLTAYLDRPEVRHALRHLGVRPLELWELEEEEPDVFASVSPMVDRDHRLWEQEGSAEAEQLGSGLTERDARCQLAELDGIEPGVRMWVDREAPAAPAPATERRTVRRAAEPIDLLDELADDIYDDGDDIDDIDDIDDHRAGGRDEPAPADDGPTIADVLARRVVTRSARSDS